MEERSIDIYDVANWKPITPPTLAEEIGAATLTFDEPSELKLTVETLDDGRVRAVVWARVKTGVDADEPAPYLMLLHDPETGKTVSFKRTNVELAL
jgi:hypothetical protein